MASLSSRILQHALAATFITLAGAGCATIDASDEDGDDAPSAQTDESALGTFRPATVAANNLRDGEIVLTFDDGPAASSGAVADVLAQRGYIGLFFAVSKHLGQVGARGVQLDETGVANLGAVVQRGHVVGNHTHEHCIAGAGGAPACGGRSFADLPAAEQRRQIELTDTLVRTALDRIGKPDAYLPFFRAPGNSWSAATASNLSSAQVSSRTYGPVAWNVPAWGEEDFRCWSQSMTPEACAARYVRAFRDLPSGQQKAVVLIHDNFGQAAELTRRFVDAIVGTRTKAGHAVHVVHPRCIVGCTR